MVKSVFSFLPSYFSSNFLAKDKISKSVSLFFSHIGPKQCWQIRLQDFKSNISLEQNNEIIYFFTCWYQKLGVDRKILGWVWWSEMIVATWPQSEWMNGWTELIFHDDENSGKLRITLIISGWLWSKLGMGL